MSIIWFGGEDLDFPNGATPYVMSAGRSGWARVAVGLSGTPTDRVIKSTVFQELTSFWFTCRMYSGDQGSGRRVVGLGKSGTEKGIFVGWGTASSRYAIHKHDGSQLSRLAEETGITGNPTQTHKIDLQLANLGASSHVRLYVNGAKLIDADVDSSIGASGLDSVYLTNGLGGSQYTASEFIVADEDTRYLGLVVNYPNEAGDLNQWTGSYDQIADQTIDDNTVLYVNSAGQEARFGVVNMPAGQFLVKAIGIKARACKAGSSAAGTLKLGLRSNGATDVDAGHTLNPYWETHERFAATINGASMTPALCDAMMIDLQSAA